MLEVLHKPDDLVCWGCFEAMTWIRNKKGLTRTDSNFYLTKTNIFFWDHPKLGRELINSESSYSLSDFSSWVPLCQSAPSTSSYELAYFCKMFQLWPSHYSQLWLQFLLPTGQMLIPFPHVLYHPCKNQGVNQACALLASFHCLK